MPKKVKIVDKRPAEIRHKVSLQSKDQAMQLIRSSYIDIDSKCRLFGMLPQTPVIDYTLSVSCTAVDDNLVISKKPLIIIKYGEQSNSSVSISAKANKVDFNIFLDPDQVIDCKDSESVQDIPYEVSYEVRLMSKSDLVTTANGKISIEIERINTAAPKFSFRPNSTGKALTYSLNYTNPIEIGELIIKNSSNLLRAPACSVYFKIEAQKGDDSSIPGLFTLGSNVKESNPRVIVGAGKPGVVPAGGSGSNFSAKTSPTKANLESIEVNKKDCRSGTNDNEISIPVIWDMSKIANPVDEVDTYTLKVTASYSFAGKPETSEKMISELNVGLHKNRVIMDLGVRFSDSEKSETLYSGINPAVRVPMMVGGLTTAYCIKLFNTAEATVKGKENARIFVRNFTLRLPAPNVAFIQMAGRIQENLFERASESTLKGEGENFTLPVKANKFIKFSYDHTCIDKIYDEGKEVYEKELLILVSFSYYVDSDAEYSSSEEIPEDKFKQYLSKIPIKISKEPKPEWLCIDFGTSAVVASYGGSFFNEHGLATNTLIPLNEQKQKKLKEWYKGDKNAANDKSESDPNLISSAAVVNLNTSTLGEKEIDSDIQKVDTDKYTESAVMLSPSSAAYGYSRMLPSLKILMGNKTLPQELLPQKVKGGEGKNAVSIEKLFELIYSQMFRYFLPDEVKETNKAILTVPNTYAPAHVAILRNLALKLFPQLRPDFTRFLSESDAVAFYYLAKKDDFIDESIKKGWKKPVHDFDKKVLVYDMGAGTLDLTYFTQEEKGGKNHITISGKMGVARAGNYLDYVLASVIVELICGSNNDYKKDLESLISTTGSQSDVTIAADSSRLKAYVRDVLKPMLNYSDKQLPALKLFNRDMPVANFTIEDVISHGDYKQFLEDVTSDVFSNFKSLFDSEDSSIEPTLVIFSGRTTSITTLREAVKDSLSSLNIIRDSCLFLNLSEGIYSSEVQSSENNISSLKTAVVDGALAFCSDFSSGAGNYVLHNKNVYAQYGIMFRVGRDWVWERLIDTHTKPISGDDTQLNQDGYTIYQYDSSKHNASELEGSGIATSDCTTSRDFGGISAAYILQSYSKDTEKDWKEGKRDMISVIGYVDLTNVEGRKSYKITIDGENQIHFMIGAGEMCLLAHDEYTSPSFRKSMWPIVDNKNKKKV